MFSNLNKTNISVTTVPKYSSKRLNVEQANTGQGRQRLLKLIKKYVDYKDSYVKKLRFDQQLSNLSELSLKNKTPQNIPPPAATIVPAPLKLIQIYFDTATYDEVERDVKVTLEAQLGLIGGTMGLLTGFSILSGVEIIYFFIKLFMSFKKSRAEISQEKLPKRVGNNIS